MPVTLLTDIAETKLAIAAGSGSHVAITDVALGDANGMAYEPTHAASMLRNERVRRAIDSTTFRQDDNTWIVRVEFPVDTPSFAVREIGFFDQDGDLIAIWAGVDVEPRQTGVIAYLIEHALSFSGVADGLIIVDAPREAYLADAAPRIAQASDRRDMAINNGAPSGGWPEIRTAQQERADHYEGRRYPGVDLATCTFGLPTEAGLVGVAPRTPFVDAIDNYDTLEVQAVRAIPVSPRVTLHNTMVGLPLFEPVQSNAYGFLVMRYIGAKPIHSVLRGTVHMMARHSNTLPSIVNQFYLGLETFNEPRMEEGQNDGRRWLAAAPGNLADPAQFATYDGFNDFCFPIDGAVLDPAASGSELWPGPGVNGYIQTGAAGYTDVLATEDNGVPIGPEVLTSQWIDVSLLKRRHLLMDFDGRSTRSRVQIMRADGSIYPDGQGGKIPARRVYRVPPDAEAMRIYYSGIGDNVSNITLRALLGNFGYNRDPISGQWSEVILPVERDVVFWPGAEYALRIMTLTRKTEDGQYTSVRDYGFRYLGGGLSFEFDARDIRQTLGDRAYAGN